MNPSPKQKLFAELGLFYAAAVWGSTFFMIRDLVSTMDPLVLTSYRFLISALLLGIYMRLKKIALWSNLKYGLILGMLVFLIYVLQAIGLQFTSATNSGFITGLFIAFVPFLSWIAYKKIPEFNKFLAVFVAVVGLWFLTGGFGNLNLGDLLTLGTAIAYALHVLFTGLVVKKLSPFSLIFQQFFFTGITCAALALGKGASFAVHTPHAQFLVLYLALIPTFSACVIQFFSQKHISEIRAALIMSLEPVFAAVFSWTIGGEAFSFAKAIGGLLIFSGMIISEMNFKKR